MNKTVFDSAKEEKCIEWKEKNKLSKFKKLIASISCKAVWNDKKNAWMKEWMKEN